MLPLLTEAAADKEGLERRWTTGMLLGLIGVMICPFRYSIPWYLAGFARPLGVGVIFVGLLREQVWLYREARARQRDLDVLHRAGQALVRSLDLTEIARTIATKALEVSGADGAILFRFDEAERVLVAMSHAGTISEQLVSGLELPLGRGASGIAVAERRPVLASLAEDDPAVPFPLEVVTRMRGEGLESVMAIPLSSQTGDHASSPPRTSSCSRRSAPRRPRRSRTGGPSTGSPSRPATTKRSTNSPNGSSRPIARSPFSET